MSDKTKAKQGGQVSCSGWYELTRTDDRDSDPVLVQVVEFDGDFYALPDLETSLDTWDFECRFRLVSPRL